MRKTFLNLTCHVPDWASHLLLSFFLFIWGPVPSINSCLSCLPRSLTYAGPVTPATISIQIVLELLRKLYHTAKKQTEKREASYSQIPEDIDTNSTMYDKIMPITVIQRKWMNIIINESADCNLLCFPFRTNSTLVVPAHHALFSLLLSLIRIIN